MEIKNKKRFYKVICLIFLLSFLFLLSGSILSSIGKFIVADDTVSKADAIIVLNTGVEYYPRLIEAADLFKKGMAPKIVINGNRKTDILRNLEQQGFKPCCSWYEDRERILELLGVPREAVTAVSAEDAYDTVSEALAVGNQLMKLGINEIIITTSKYHTKRAEYVWSKLFDGKISIRSVSAKADPYNPEGWWKEGRQIKWVLAEYGGWLYDRIKLLKGNPESSLQISYIEPITQPVCQSSEP